MLGHRILTSELKRLCSLLGTTIGIGLSSVLSHDTYNFAIGFAALTVVHQGCNYLSLKAVPLAHFNRQRLEIVLKHFTTSGKIPSPAELAKEEVFFPFLSADTTKSWLSIGQPLEKVCPDPSDLQHLLNAAQDEAYILNIVESHIHLVFFKEVTGEDMIRGMFHAFLAKKELENMNGFADPATILKRTHADVIEQFRPLMQLFHENGWRTDSDSVSLESSSARRLSIG